MPQPDGSACGLEDTLSHDNVAWAGRETGRGVAGAGPHSGLSSRTSEGQAIMHKSRLEAFSDGVLAILITIMVLELKVPHGQGLADLTALWPVFTCYVLSFLYLGIYWNNHHHLLQSVGHVNGAVLWANLHLLFWLSLIPFTTAWMGKNDFARMPTFVYGVNLLACAIAFYILQTGLQRLEGRHSLLSRALGRDWKGKLSPVLYLLGMAGTLWLAPAVGFVFYTLVALVWLVPDRRIERVLTTTE